MKNHNNVAANEEECVDLVSKVESIWHKAKTKREKRVMAMMLRGRGGDEGRTVPEKESWVSFVFFRLF